MAQEKFIVLSGGRAVIAKGLDDAYEKAADIAGAVLAERDSVTVTVKRAS